MPIYRFTVSEEVHYVYEVELDSIEEAEEFAKRVPCHESAADYMDWAEIVEEPYRLLRVSTNAPDEPELLYGPDLVENPTHPYWEDES